MATAGDLQIHPGTILGECYKVEELLGEGGFGLVSKCLNSQTNEMVAIKVNRNDGDVIRQSRREIAILKKLQCLDSDTCNIVKWNGFFFHKDNICLNFELLDQSLFDYLDNRSSARLTMTQLRPIIYQLATTLSHLSSMELVHADLKPDNIMVVNRLQQPLKVKLIDFGLARPVSATEPGDCVQTIWYRAPEVILESPFNEAIDMWSLGLVAAELALGGPLYPGQTHYEMLKYIIEAQGQLPDHMLDRGLSTQCYFNQQSNGEQRWTLKTPEQIRSETETEEDNLELRFIKVGCLDELERWMINDGEDQSDRLLLVDLIKRMLQLDPDQRIKPQEVLQHPFFTQNLPQSSSPDTHIEITDSEETPEDNRLDQAAGPDTDDCRVEITTENLAAEQGEYTEEADIQPDSHDENVGWFRRFFRWIRGKASERRKKQRSWRFPRFFTRDV